MDTTKLKKFAQYARRTLLEQVAGKLEMVLAPHSAARREQPQAVADLEKQIKEFSRDQVVERVAYTWFNRFCALRFMDVNRYTRIGVVSPAEGQFQPEILAEAKMGHIDEDMVATQDRQKIVDLLAGKAPGHDPQGEAYRMLVVAACNAWHKAMPFLFERISDYTELLMPDDLLSGNSILAYTREAMTPDACADVEVIGWLYQFYISEKKDAVFEGLKKNQKIIPENIPAATQLFTPHWIVRYLVDNSLGRLWLLNRPNSRLVEQMEYYIPPEQPETDFLKINGPEDIKVCDPACGSGHMLTYAFDLLYAMYEEEGCDPAEIPEKILTHNLFGIELDERAGELAAFALTMKARARQRRFFNKGIKPNICVLEKVSFSREELDEYMSAVGRDLFTYGLREILQQFSEADNFGSLIVPKVGNVADVLATLESKDMHSSNLFLADTHQRVLSVLRMADYLSPRYAVVVANPPYMGGKGMNGRLSAWLKENYLDVKSDLFSAFIVRCMGLSMFGAYLGVMCPNVWMYIYSHEKLRGLLVEKKSITNLVELPLSGFKGATVQICAFNFINCSHSDLRGTFIRLVDLRGDDDDFSLFVKRAISEGGDIVYKILLSKISKIPGSPVAYWASDRIIDSFVKFPQLGSVASPHQGMATTNNGLFLRRWHEVGLDGSKRDAISLMDAAKSKSKWFPIDKGGEYRKWFGNNEFYVNYKDNGKELCEYIDANSSVGASGRVINREKYFIPGVTWSAISSSYFSVRYTEHGHAFSNAGMKVFHESEGTLRSICALLNSKVTTALVNCLSQTLNYDQGVIARIPVAISREAIGIGSECIRLSRLDWDSYETSWGFSCSPLLNIDWCQPTIKATYQVLRTHWREMTLEMQRLEEENNRAFIDAYGLQDELTAEVPLEEITLTCNPAYRYGGVATEEELEERLCADTMAEFLSYAVGCMFGRYSLDKPGLVLANQAETLADYLQQVPEPRFMPDEDNVIPVLDGEWFADDVTERFRQFLRVTFGEEHYEENVAFIETALGKDVRKYFLKDFYADHVKRYKKRPIYWLFSSPKGTFNALVYLHRYRPDTVSVVLQYLRDFRKKLAARLDYLQQVAISPSASQGEKTKANKEAETIKKQLLELDDYERETLYPLATEQVQLDLDDGVKVNYLKLGSALKKIVGLDAKGED